MEGKKKGGSPSTHVLKKEGEDTCEKRSMSLQAEVRVRRERKKKNGYTRLNVKERNKLKTKKTLYLNKRRKDSDTVRKKENIKNKKKGGDPYPSLPPSRGGGRGQGKSERASALW